MKKQTHLVWPEAPLIMNEHLINALNKQRKTYNSITFYKHTKSSDATYQRTYWVY